MLGFDIFGAKSVSSTLHDNNGDGIIDGNDITVAPGSPEAKVAWEQIYQVSHGPAAVAKAKAAGYENANGWYKGGPLIPGQVSEGQKDFDFLTDKLVYKNGFSPEVAAKIAAKAKTQMLAKSIGGHSSDEADDD